MKNIKVLIAEDEDSVVKNLQFFISKVAPDLVKEYFIADSYDKALTILSGPENFNLSILDVKLPGGKSFELIETFPMDKFGVVAFMSNEPVPAHINALAQPVLQILKPLGVEKVAVLISEAQRQINNKENYSRPKVYRYSFKEKNEHFIFTDGDIIYIQSHQGYLHIYTNLRERPFVGRKKENSDEIFAKYNPEVFLRCHESYLINVERVVKIEKDKKNAGGVIKLKAFRQEAGVPFHKNYRKEMITMGLLSAIENIDD